MEDTEVTRLPSRLPATVSIPDNPSELGMTPREMRELKAASGQRLDYLMGDESDLDEKTQMMVWLILRREGFDPTWEEAGEVRPVAREEPPDPTSEGR